MALVADMSTTQAPRTEPVTTVFTWQVRPGREADFEEWTRGATDCAPRFPGNQGVSWLRPDHGHRHLAALQLFDRQQGVKRSDFVSGTSRRAGRLASARPITKTFFSDTGHRPVPSSSSRPTTEDRLSTSQATPLRLSLEPQVKPW
jgi:hypothetical protein